MHSVLRHHSGLYHHDVGKVDVDVDVGKVDVAVTVLAHSLDERPGRSRWKHPTCHETTKMDDPFEAYEELVTLC